MLCEARAAMEGLAATLAPEELNRIGFRLYEGSRPDVPQGAEGWGAQNSPADGNDYWEPGPPCDGMTDWSRGGRDHSGTRCPDQR